MSPANANSEKTLLSPRIEPMLRLPEVRRITGAGKTTIYRWIRKGQFPRAITISPGYVAWRSSEIEDWQRQRFDSASTD